MTQRLVTTQADLDSALADGSVTEILIDSPRGVWLTVEASGSATVRAYARGEPFSSRPTVTEAGKKILFGQTAGNVPAGQ